LVKVFPRLCPVFGMAPNDGGLYVKMMSSMRTGHKMGNTIRFLKLPLILTDTRLYAGAISNFYWLTHTLERALVCAKEDKMIRVLRDGLGLPDRAPAYEKDLQQLLGDDWRVEALKFRTAATDAYCAILEAAPPEELVGAAFILYGALVVGGGKKTQAKVRNIFPSCDHALFDVAEDMDAARQRFRQTFSTVGEQWPDHVETFTKQSQRFMALNNTVLGSIRCMPYWWWKATVVAGVFGVCVVTSYRVGWRAK